MARKPNYNFERRERERLKAEKKAKRAAEKKEAREKKSWQSQPSAQSGGQNPLSPTVELPCLSAVVQRPSPQLQS